MINQPGEQSSSARVCGTKSHCSRLPRPPDLLQTYMVPSDHCRGRLLGPERSPRTLRLLPELVTIWGGRGWVGDTPLVVRTGTTLRLPSCPPRIACLYMFSVVCVSCPGSVKSRKSFQLGVCMSVRLFVQPSKSQRQDNVESKETGIAASFPPQIPCTYSHTHTYFILAFFFCLSNRTTLLRQLHQEGL